MAEQTEGTAVFMVGKWFCTLKNYVNFSEVHIPEGYYQWFVDIVAYLKILWEIRPA